MDDGKQFDQAIIFTIGHSNHGLKQFVTLLKDNSIDVVVDIRSRPYSRFAPHFNKAALQDSLHAHGIRYLFLGDKLGGRPGDRRFYDSEGHVLYARISETPEFHEGVDSLIKGCNEYRPALMCSEENPLNCHRYLLVGRFLENRGVTIIHIRGDGSQQSEKELVRENKANINTEKQQNFFPQQGGE
jgi:uncharacterized protein (DUF488 family)